MLTSNGYVLDESPTRLGFLEPVPATHRHDRDALWARLRNHGYLYFKRFFDPDSILEFRRYYFEALAESGLVERGSDPVLGVAGSGPDDNELIRRVLFSEIVPGARYREFCTQKPLRDFYAWFLGGQTHLHKRKIIRHHRPGEVGVGLSTQAHYDLLYIREGTDRVLSSWIPLGDVPVARGGLVYLEGSQEWVLSQEAVLQPTPVGSLTADLPSLADERDSRWLIADYEAGDMVVHSAFTVHAALDNRDGEGRIRLSTDIRYQRADEAIDLRWQQDWSPTDGL